MLRILISSVFENFVGRKVKFGAQKEAVWIHWADRKWSKRWKMKNEQIQWPNKNCENGLMKSIVLCKNFGHQISIY